ncbi:MAG: hypothetical protein P9M15_08030, partial [Candidatus Electryoneaceae bacterium]|nr:hypothetical protein [Candidatus Electryoneaceae bacterium]
ARVSLQIMNLTNQPTPPYSPPTSQGKLATIVLVCFVTLAKARVQKTFAANGFPLSSVSDNVANGLSLRAKRSKLLK